MWIEKLYAEQRPSFEFVISRPGAMLISETSAGKTIISMAAIEQLRPQLLLIVAPLTSLDITWSPKLLGKWIDPMNGDQPVLKDCLLSRDLEEFQQLRKTLQSGWCLILLIHFQPFAKHATKLERVPWDLVIIDESQGIKDRGTAASRAARRVRHAKRRLALSATPLDKSPIDIWAQMRFVDHTVFGEDFTPFKQNYCTLGGFKDHEVKFVMSRLPDFLQRLEPYVMRLDKTFLQLKPLRIHTVPVLLLGSQARLYEQMHEHGIVTVGDGQVIPAPLAVTRQAKLEQITGGTIKDLTERSHVVGRAKQRKLRFLVGKLQPPLVIFCKYLAELPLIHAALPRLRVEMLTGAIVGDERTELINDFQKGEVDCLICQTRTGGVSIELTAAATLIFYSMNFSLIDFTQVIGRFHRGSQDREVNVYVLYAPGTVDEKIAMEIEAKKATFSAVVDHFTQRDAVGAA